MRTISKHSGRIEVRPALRAIADAKATWLSAFNAACRHDGIPEGSKFVEFSEDNPFLPYVDKAYEIYCEMKRVYQVGGYVGLRMG